MELRLADRVRNLKGNAIREIFKLLENPEVVSFAGGNPAPDTLECGRVREFADRALSAPDGWKILQYGSTEGYLPLRKSMLKYVERCGIFGMELDNNLIVSGGQQAIDLTLKAFVNKGDTVLVEDPTYLAFLHIAKTYEANIVGVASEDDGFDLADLEEKMKKYRPKVLYAVPNFSNPTGKTLPAEKRKAIAALAEQYDVIVLEDDPYRELRYSGEPQPAIKSFDRSGHVLYATSFSKTIAPALRVGAVFGAPEVVRKLVIGKQAADVHTATLPQAIVNEYLKDGIIETHIAECVSLYREKRDAMVAAIREHFPEDFRYVVPEGGLFLFGTFTSGLSAKALFPAAVEKYKVAYVCGNDFFADGRGDNCVRLNFSMASVENIRAGIERLGNMFKNRG